MRGWPTSCASGSPRGLRAGADVVDAAVKGGGVVDAIARTWRDPRGVMAARVAAGLTESRALADLMVACALFFVART